MNEFDAWNLRLTKEARIKFWAPIGAVLFVVTLIILFMATGKPN